MGSWAVCGLTYATDGGGAYNGAVFTVLVLIAGSLTAGAALAVVGAWRTAEARVVVPTVLSVLAASSILALALAISSRG